MQKLVIPTGASRCFCFSRSLPANASACVVEEPWLDLFRTKNRMIDVLFSKNKKHGQRRALSSSPRLCELCVKFFASISYLVTSSLLYFTLLIHPKIPNKQIQPPR